MDEYVPVTTPIKSTHRKSLMAIPDIASIMTITSNTVPEERIVLESVWFILMLIMSLYDLFFSNFRFSLILSKTMIVSLME